MNDPARLADQLDRDVPGLRAVLLFGSALAPRDSGSATSIPDLVAIVDDLDAALAAFDVTPARPARWRGPLPADHRRAPRDPARAEHASPR